MNAEFRKKAIEAMLVREQAIRDEFRRIQQSNREMGLDDPAIANAFAYAELSKEIQESVDVSLVHAGLRDVEITAEPVNDDPPALPAPDEGEQP